jgi:hypothetical protein
VGFKPTYFQTGQRAQCKSLNGFAMIGHFSLRQVTVRHTRALGSPVWKKWVDEIVEMSDAVIGQPQEIVTATRNAVDARKWVASKLVPRVYGDQPTGITINNKTNVMVISEEQQRELQETRRRLLEARGDKA